MKYLKSSGSHLVEFRTFRALYRSKCFLIFFFNINKSLVSSEGKLQTGTIKGIRHVVTYIISHRSDRGSLLGEQVTNSRGRSIFNINRCVAHEHTRANSPNLFCSPCPRRAFPHPILVSSHFVSLPGGLALFLSPFLSLFATSLFHYRRPLTIYPLLNSCLSRDSSFHLPFKSLSSTLRTHVHTSLASSLLFFRIPFFFLLSPTVFPPPLSHPLYGQRNLFTETKIAHVRWIFVLGLLATLGDIN